MCTLDIILSELKKQGKTQASLAQYLGMTKNAVSEWKSGRNEAYKKKLPEIADFLDVSISYLIGENTQTEKEIDDNDIKFALFGDVDIDDEVLEEVRHYAQIAKQMREERKKDGKT